MTSKKQNNNDSLWDEMLKAIVERMPEQLLPLIEDVFQVTYEKGTKIRILPTNKVVPKNVQNRKLTSIYSDIAVQIGSDYYHLESQLKNDKFMAIRMIRYDFHLALSNSVTEIGPNEYLIEFPKSVVLYMEPNSNIPDKLICHVKYADGNIHDYTIPTLKLSDYNLKQIQDKHLTIFIPFLLLQLRPRLKSKSNPLSSAELTDFVNQLIFILKTELNNNRISKNQFEDFIDLLDQAACRVFSNDEQYRNQVINMTKSTIILPSERYERYEKKLAKKDAALAEKDAIIADLRAQLAEINKEKADDKEQTK